MSTELPYLVTNKRLADLFGKIQSASVPQKFTYEFLKKLGFASSNDRALPSLLKKLARHPNPASPTAPPVPLRLPFRAERGAAGARRLTHSVDQQPQNTYDCTDKWR
jgi:hypothetical protein